MNIRGIDPGQQAGVYSLILIFRKKTFPNQDLLVSQRSPGLSGMGSAGVSREASRSARAMEIT